MDRVETIRKDIEKCYNEALRRAKESGDDYWNGKADADRNALISIDMAKGFTVMFQSVIGELYVHTTLDKCGQIIIDKDGTPLFTRKRADVDSEWSEWKALNNKENDKE